MTYSHSHSSSCWIRIVDIQCPIGDVHSFIWRYFREIVQNESKYFLPN